MTDDLHDVIALGRPTVVHNSRSIASVVDLFPVHHNLAFSRGDRPRNDDIVLFPATVRARSSLIEGISVGESKAPIIKRKVKQKVCKFPISYCE
jgi:hypothetical protein